MADQHRAVIFDHYAKRWGHAFTEHRWPRGPIHQLPEGFCVLEFPPHGDRGMWVYATCCMSQPEDNRKVEAFLYAADPSDQHVECLTVLAHYHRTGSPVYLSHTVFFGRPWLPESTCSYGFLSVAYIEPPDFATLNLPNDGQVTFAWLIPITKEERDHVKQFGVEALEKAFEKAKLNYLDFSRNSVV